MWRCKTGEGRDEFVDGRSQINSVGEANIACIGAVGIYIYVRACVHLTVTFKGVYLHGVVINKKANLAED